MPQPPLPDPQRDRDSAGSVYELIRAQILRNEITPDERINIDALARELSVSPTPVREALRQLQGDNLVVQHPGRGYSTTSLLNERELREMFEFRLLVEPWAARAAAQDRLGNPGYLLDRQLSELEELATAQGDVRFQLVEHDTAFHDVIFAAAENEVLHSAYRQTHCHLHAFRLFPNDHTGEKTVQEHRDIARAIRERDPDAAEAAMRHHLITAYLRFSEGYASPARLPGTAVDRPGPNTRLSL